MKPKPDTYNSRIISTYVLTRFATINPDFLFSAITVEDI